MDGWSCAILMAGFRSSPSVAFGYCGLHNTRLALFSLYFSPEASTISEMFTIFTTGREELGKQKVRKVRAAAKARPKAVDGPRFWVITETDRSATTFLLPEEY